MVDVFLSYARQDEDRAELLRGLLEAQGWDVWWDSKIRIGEPWGEAIESALTESRAIVVLWTEPAAASEWVLREADHGRERGQLLGVKLEPCDVPERFLTLEMAMMEGWKGEPYDREFQQLLLTLEEQAPPSRRDQVRAGFQPWFLGADRRIGWPSPPGIAEQLHYLHFSVVSNPARRMPWYVAYNVDGATLQRPARMRHEWAQDPLISEKLQPEHRHFRGSGFDRGYLVARSLLTWGDQRDARIAGVQAGFWTNVGPQHRDLNRRTYLSVERWEQKLAGRRGRLVGLCGPVFGAADPPFRDEQEGDDGFIAYRTFCVPMAYWKVVAVLGDGGGIAVQAFRFENALPGDEGFRARLQSADWRRPATHRVGISDIAAETGLKFPDALLEAPELPFG